MKAEIKLGKDAIIEAIRSYIKREGVRGHIVDIRFTGYSSPEATILIEDRVLEEPVEEEPADLRLEETL